MQRDIVCGGKFFGWRSGLLPGLLKQVGSFGRFTFAFQQHALGTKFIDGVFRIELHQAKLTFIGYFWAMTLYEFNVLDDNAKADAIWAGSFLADREENGLMLQLYAIDSFYAEVTYDPAANKILTFRSFNAKHLLAPYLAQIKFKL